MTTWKAYLQENASKFLEELVEFRVALTEQIINKAFAHQYNL